MEEQFKKIAALIGDPVRATILWSLMDGRSMSASELAVTADTSPQNMSMHLSKLLQSNLLIAESQGRQRYYQFARKEIAQALEAMTLLIPYPEAAQRTVQSNEPEITYCRTCYDHLAGKIGVAIADSLLKQKWIRYAKDGLLLTDRGMNWFGEMGIGVDKLKRQRRAFLRPCIDWSERRTHIAGSLAAALLDKMFELAWIRKVRNSRAVVITAAGRKALYKKFHIEF
jgi:DNA-binding transcriptional ArsR family regulator